MKALESVLKFRYLHQPVLPRLQYVKINNYIAPDNIQTDCNKVCYMNLCLPGEIPFIVQLDQLNANL